ncbi:hypothetical protein HMPREF0973_01400 [Prevotella veroralis F0319]|uniref:Uncharacterized protein n=1 Tax=Prevotella veroralis F0319 TaxID=649761 RepID=C9MP62_9BACT|nr:hypothetical protein HMPREF0973_01400 [Prevotella veroralis F0319]
MKRASLHIEETPSLFVNNTIYSPLHSERGWGRGFFSPLGRGWGRFLPFGEGTGVRLLLSP